MKQSLIVFMLCLVIFTLACSQTFGQSDTGLIARYTFDDGPSPIVKDSSGNGLDGKLSSGTKYVNRGNGYALDINTPIDGVGLGCPPALVLKGDTTIEAWIKSDYVEKDDQLIFGDTAGKGVDRNILFFNSRGKLRVDHGNGYANETFFIDTPVFDGKWHHVVFVTEFPNYYFFVDGKLAKRGNMVFDITPTKADNRAIGGWWAGFFKGSIDDVRIYKRAISGNEIALHANAKPNTKPLVNINVRPIWQNKTLKVEIWVGNWTPAYSKVRLSLSYPGSSKPMSKEIELKETRSGSGRALIITSFKTPSLAKGNYRIKAQIVSHGGKSLITAGQNWQSVGIPVWLTAKAGVTDKVLAPWTPIKVITEKTGNIVKAIDVQVWGRTYRFSNSLFPTDITSNSVSLINAPIKVTVRINGVETIVSNCQLKLKQNTPTVASLRITGNAGGIDFTATHRIEYDGMIRSHWTATSKTKVKLDGLSMEIPFASAHSPYLYFQKTLLYSAYDPALKVGKIPNGTHSMGFSPFVWFGDDERGMEWACESENNWYNIDPAKSMTISKNEVTTSFKLSIVDRPIEIGSGRNLDYTFILQASPVKPIIEDSWDYRIVSCAIVDYSRDYDMLTKKVGDLPVLDYYKKVGIKTVIIANWTNIITYTSPVGHETDLHNLVRECHKRGIKVVPYFGYQISELAPEWQYFKEDIIVLPDSVRGDRYPGMDMQQMHNVCLNSLWKDFLTSSIAKLMDKYDVDGVYMDTTIHPYPCMNISHGCGVYDLEGTLRPTIPIFGVRDTIKRLYQIVKSRKPDGVVDLHIWDSMNLPSLSWGTTYWNGEQITPYGGVVKNYADKLPLDMYSTEFMGKQWGVQGEFLHHPLGVGFNNSFAITLLHDTVVRPLAEGTYGIELISRLWNTMEKFGRKQAEWLPYWKNSDYVWVSREEVYVSLYKHPGNGVLAVVSNLSQQPGKIDVRFNLQKLGLAGKNLSATDTMSENPIALSSGELSLDLPVLGWNVIWIK